MPGDDDLDDLIDSYVADAMRSTGLPAEKRSKPPTASPAPRTEPVVAPAPIADPSPPPRAKAPTPTGVALLAAALFDDVSSQVAIPAPLVASELREAPAPLPPEPVGPSIRFVTPSSPRPSLPPPAFPEVHAPDELYVMPPLPGSGQPAQSSVPDTLPGVGPVSASTRSFEAFASDIPTDPDAPPAIVDQDDEPTNVLSRPQP